MSIRDQIRPHTPSATPDECDVPLQQLARLKEKLIKHSRAEDAAMKRIRDLEMQLTSLKRDHEVNFFKLNHYCYLNKIFLNVLGSST